MQESRIHPICFKCGVPSLGLAFDGRYYCHECIDWKKERRLAFGEEKACDRRTGSFCLDTSVATEPLLAYARTVFPSDATERRRRWSHSICMHWLKLFGR